MKSSKTDERGERSETSVRGEPDNRTTRGTERARACARVVNKSGKREGTVGRVGSGERRVG